MSATTSNDVNFVPKVWSDHAMAYFDRSMALGALALVDKTLEAEPGETVNFPYYKKMNGMQKPAEDEGLIVDKLLDDSFSVTVEECGKAVGWKDKAKRKSAQQDPEGEAQRQLGILTGEQIDQDLIDLINTNGNFKVGTTAADYATGKLTINKLLEHLIVGFGDKQKDCVAHAMHSLHFLEVMNNAPSGLLVKTDNDPFNGLPGFEGRLLGKALFVLDTLPQQANIDGKKAFPVFSFKANPYGLYMAEEFKLEKDRDILHRENIMAGTLWYGVLSLHSKVSTADLRTIRSVFPTGQAA